MNTFRDIFYVIVLLLLCIFILIILSPIIDHFFYIHKKIKNIKKSKILLMIISHILLVGILILSIHYILIDNYLTYFNIKLKPRYIKLLIDLIVTLTLIGLQRNLLYKIEYISTQHPIRSKLIE